MKIEIDLKTICSDDHWDDLAKVILDEIKNEIRLSVRRSLRDDATYKKLVKITRDAALKTALKSLDT